MFDKIKANEILKEILYKNFSITEQSATSADGNVIYIQNDGNQLYLSFQISNHIDYNFIAQLNIDEEFLKGFSEEYFKSYINALKSSPAKYVEITTNGRSVKLTYLDKLEKADDIYHHMVLNISKELVKLHNTAIAKTNRIMN